MLLFAFVRIRAKVVDVCVTVMSTAFRVFVILFAMSWQNFILLYVLVPFDAVSLGIKLVLRNCIFLLSLSISLLMMVNGELFATARHLIVLISEFFAYSVRGKSKALCVKL